MKRGTTRTLNKKLQNIEERLLGPQAKPVTILLINTFSLVDDPKPDKARLSRQYQQASNGYLLNIHVVENYKIESPSMKPTT